MEHKMKQDSLDRSQSDLKKLRRKSQGKNANKYENKESEVRRTWTHLHVRRSLGRTCVCCRFLSHPLTVPSGAALF